MYCMSVCKYVCMYVRNGFLTDVYKFTYTLRTFQAHVRLGEQIKTSVNKLVMKD